MGTEEKINDSAGKPAADSKPGWMTRQLGGFYRWRDVIKEHPLKGTGLAVAIFVLGVLGNEAIGRVMDKFRDPDQFLVQMKDDQQQNFEALKTSLSELRGSLDSNGNAALQQVASAAEALQNTNVRLVEELALAKRENDTLRQAVRNSTGMEGGLHFIVRAAGSWQLVPQPSIRLPCAASTSVRVPRTSRDTDGSAPTHHRLCASHR